jgi:hypothetical protein
MFAWHSPRMALEETYWKGPQRDQGHSRTGFGYSIAFAKPCVHLILPNTGFLAILPTGRKPR